jgi:hypothetical protein
MDNTVISNKLFEEHVGVQKRAAPGLNVKSLKKFFECNRGGKMSSKILWNKKVLNLYKGGKEEEKR